jgi:hypothetical protein
MLFGVTEMSLAINYGSTARNEGESTYVYLDLIDL